MNEQEMFTEAHSRLESAAEAYRQANEVCMQWSVLLIALTARDIYGPAAHSVTLTHSDQGDFLSLAGVLDEAGVDLADEDLAADEHDAAERRTKWDDFNDSAEAEFAWNLGRSDAWFWEEYMAEDDGPLYVLPIEDTITTLGSKL